MAATPKKSKRRPDGRAAGALRPVILQTGVNRYAEGSCLIKMGNTHVLCLASVSEDLPKWKKDSGEGWVTAEYAMLPRATHTRSDREAVKGKQSGRSQEISRLIGRSLRAVVDFKKLGARVITVDCDVLQADGGTRCASITGGYVALKLAVKNLLKSGALSASPLTGSVAAVSVGMFEKQLALDLSYEEDSSAEVDMNVVMTGAGRLVEIQGTGEHATFSLQDAQKMLKMAATGIRRLTRIQQTK